MAKSKKPSSAVRAHARRRLSRELRTGVIFGLICSVVTAAIIALLYLGSKF